MNERVIGELRKLLWDTVPSTAWNVRESLDRCSEKSDGTLMYVSDALSAMRKAYDLGVEHEGISNAQDAAGADL